MRTALTREVWEAVNESWMLIREALARPVRERVVWMIELFERLEQQRLSERLNGRGAR